MLKRARENLAMHIAILTPGCRTDGVTLGLLLTLIFWGGLILRSGDVEQNPGPVPPRSDTSRQTRLTSSGRRISVDRPTSATDRGQPTPSSFSPPQDPPTLSDVMTMLQAMSSKVDRVETTVNELKEQFAALQGEVKGLREEVGALHQENEELIKTNADLTDRIIALEKKTEHLEAKSRRNNLIFHGIKRQPDEDCEEIIQDLLRDKLDLPSDIEFDRVHRLSGKADAPVLAQFCFYKDKVRILKEKTKLKGTDVFVNEDFSAGVRNIRRKLLPLMKDTRSKGKKCFMVFDHLVIEGVKFYLDDNDKLDPPE